jgi:hypothetical protein
LWATGDLDVQSSSVDVGVAPGGAEVPSGIAVELVPSPWLPQNLALGWRNSYLAAISVPEGIDIDIEGDCAKVRPRSKNGVNTASSFIAG